MDEHRVGSDSKAKSNGPPPRLALTWPWFPVTNPEPGTLSLVGVAPLVWNGKDDSLNLASGTIAEPLLYSSVDASNTHEPSCINTALETAGPGESDVIDPGYWPDYATLSPSQRGRYLEWLAGGRKTPINDGYLLLFLFGLERRVLTDGADHETILRELLALLSRNKSSEIFYNAASHFVAFVFAHVKIGRIREYWFKRLFLSPTTDLHDDALRVALTWLYQHDKSLPGVLAYQVGLRDPRCRKLSGPIKELKKFRAQFLKRYAATHPGGIPLQKTNQTQEFSYRPLNPSLQGWQNIDTFHVAQLPDLSGTPEQFAPIVHCWNESIAETDLDHSEAPARDRDKWISIVSDTMKRLEHARTSIHRITKEFAIQPEYRNSLSMDQSLSLVDAASKEYFSLEPHPHVLLRPFRLDDTVAIVPVKNRPNDDSENYYLAASLLLGMGIAMAAADGIVDRSEALHLPVIVNAQFHFGDDDRKRIAAYGELMLDEPPDLVPYAHRFRREMPPALSQPLGDFLIGIAAVNGVVEASEQIVINSVFHALGLQLPEKANTGVPGDGAPGMLDNLVENLGQAYQRIQSNLRRARLSQLSAVHPPKMERLVLSLGPEFDLHNLYEMYDETITSPHHIKVSGSESP